MGYYWNGLEDRWDPIDHDRKLSRAQRQQIERREHLIQDLIAEIRSGSDSVIKMYAGLAARALTASDEALLRKYSRPLAAMCPEVKKPGRVNKAAA